MARLFTDENIPTEVVQRLRELGHDILTAFEAGRAKRRIDDQNVLTFATNQQRTVVTINRRDFIRLHAQKPDHARIIVCTHDTDFKGQAERINAVLNNTPSLAGRLLRIVRPQQ